MKSVDLGFLFLCWFSVSAQAGGADPLALDYSNVRSLFDRSTPVTAENFAISGAFRCTEYSPKGTSTSDEYYVWQDLGGTHPIYFGGEFPLLVGPQIFVDALSDKTKENNGIFGIPLLNIDLIFRDIDTKGGGQAKELARVSYSRGGSIKKIRTIRFIEDPLFLPGGVFVSGGTAFVIEYAKAGKRRIGSGGSSLAHRGDPRAYGAWEARGYQLCRPCTVDVWASNGERICVP